MEQIRKRYRVFGLIFILMMVGSMGIVAQTPITTTHSSVLLVEPETPSPVSPLQIQTDLSGPLIRLDAFRNDARFSAVDGAGYTVVILDTGIDLDHPFFGPDSDGNGVADRIVYHYDFADGDANAQDVNGHGSNVSSIAASSDATYGGMAPGANIIHLKIFEDSGTGSFSYMEDALQWVVANGTGYNIVSVNISAGDAGKYKSYQSLYGIDDELSVLASLDIAVVASVGNNFTAATGVTYPAADENSLAVGAVYDADIGPVVHNLFVEAYSTGPDRLVASSQRHITMTTVFAPGATITGAGASGGITTLKGTSQAAPHVAGMIVLMQQLAGEILGRKLTVAEIRSIINSSSVSIYDGDDEDDNVFNTNQYYRRIDVLAFAEAVLTLDTVPPQVVQVDIDPSGITLTFSEWLQNPTGDSSLVDVTNPASYLLVRSGQDNLFQTEQCGDIQGDDQAIPLQSVSYDQANRRVTLNLEAGINISGTYFRLIGCHTGLKDLANHTLDGNKDGLSGDDFIYDSIRFYYLPLIKNEFDAGRSLLDF